MKSLNKVTLIGNVGQAVEKRTLGPNGGSVAHCSLATNRKWTDKNGQAQTDTQWHRLTFFGKLADIAEKYVKKGMALYVEGEIRYSERGEGDQKKHYVEIVVSDMNMLTFADDEKSDRGPAKSEAKSDKGTRAKAPATPEPVAAAAKEEDDDLPF